MASDMAVDGSLVRHPSFPSCFFSPSDEFALENRKRPMSTEDDESSPASLPGDTDSTLILTKSFLPGLVQYAGGLRQSQINVVRNQSSKRNPRGIYLKMLF
jgi:hypothetical protein